MKKENMTPQMKRMCSKFEVSCVGCPYSQGDSCNIENLTEEQTEVGLKNWLDGKYWSSVYNVGK